MEGSRTFMEGKIITVDGKVREEEDEAEELIATGDGAVDRHNRPAIRNTTGGWVSGALILVNQGLATLAFFGVGVNLVLFLTRVVGQDNASAANNVSKWTGTVYIFSLLGAFLSDSYWGRYYTCAIFQSIFVLGLGLLSLSSYIFLLKPRGCGDEETLCGPHSALEMAIFYVSIYMVALGNGGYQPNIATFGADQFDEEDPSEGHSKIAFFSYFYLALNLGSLFSNTVLGYFEDEGRWTLGFWASSASAALALLLFLSGTYRYRHFRPRGNPLSRFCQVVAAASRKWKVEVYGDEDLYEIDDRERIASGERKILHTRGFSFLDKAAAITEEVDVQTRADPWRLCTVTQVEEVKCILRLLPIWLCTILYSVVFTQMASLFVEQGAAMQSTVSGGFHIPPASMSSFDILSVAAFIFIYRRVLDPVLTRLRSKTRGGLSELQRMGIGLVIAILAMVSAGTVEVFRLKYATTECPSCEGSSSLSIFWQVPQYVLIGASEVFMYVGQLEFFNSQAPDGLKSIGSALCMTSISLGNYVSSLLVTIVMKFSARDNMPGWIPRDLNRGHLDRFFFLLAVLTTADLAVYILTARWYRYIEMERKMSCTKLDDSTSKLGPNAQRV
ncbi:hypothetical protein SAY87_025267 [Trapa incisa]|uniref:Nitrate transporter 1.5 n=1 Tax=Trapa incisa TaxID=236973 RepID=A0AAN7GHG3_9MYRT|nr:hypothetical protein SAY87_025267 [Trapa incisa]